MSVAKKVAIVVVAIVLLCLFALIDYLLNRPAHVNTVGKIVYLSDRGNPGYQHIWISSADGHDARQLTSGKDEQDSSPSFSPSGSQIIYISDQSGSPQVWVMDANGENAHAITFGNASRVKPAFSPDGSMISYITDGKLWVTSTNGQDTEVVLPQLPQNSGSTEDVQHAPVMSVVSYAWQPGKDTTGIAAVVNNGENTKVLDGLQDVEYVPTLDGTPLHLGAGAVVSFEWKPDGSAIMAAIMDMVLCSPGQEAASKLPPDQYGLVPAVGKGQTFSGIFTFTKDNGLSRSPEQPPLATFTKGTAGPQNPAIFPDGSKVAFELWPFPSPDPSKIEGIALVPTDASAPPSGIVRGPAYDFKWSPDGKYFALIAPVPHSSGNSDLYIGDPAAGTLSPITDHTAHVSDEAWSPQLPDSN